MNMKMVAGPTVFNHHVFFIRICEVVSFNVTFILPHSCNDLFYFFLFKNRNILKDSKDTIKQKIVGLITCSKKEEVHIGNEL